LQKRGWLGQKSGQGFYQYRGKSKKVHQAALDLLPKGDYFDSSTLLRRLPRPVQMREATERMVLLMVNEAAACLGEAVVADAATIDLAMILGIGWAPHRGGPLRYGRERGFQKAVEALETLAQRLGARFHPCDALRELAGKE